MKSKITGGPTEIVFSKKILNKYDVKYHRCIETGFIQTDEPYWLGEAYSSAITKLDIGMIYRNSMLKDKAGRIINSHFDASQRFLDYAGGYGLFTRMMRDKGYDFYHSDIYCKNIFAEYFDLKDCAVQSDFELVTAFEVFEHLVNPMGEIEEIIKLGKNILFSTELQPVDLPIANWWYLTPETGQHIALYTAKSLRYIAEHFNLHYSTDGISLHLFSRERMQYDPFEEKKEPYLVRLMRRKLSRFDRKKDNRQSLLMNDFEYIKEKLNSDNQL